MSISRAIVARAEGAPELAAMIDGRIFRQGAVQNVAVPFIEFDIGPSNPVHTMGVGADLSKVQVTLKLFAAGAVELDELEAAARVAFHKFEGPAGGEEIVSWVSNSFDSPVTSRQSDILARVYSRTLEIVMALVQA